MPCRQRHLPGRRAALAALLSAGAGAVLAPLDGPGALAASTASTASTASAGSAGWSWSDGTILRPIPATGELLPAIGMGTWLTFDVGGDEAALASRLEVLRAFFEGDGAMIDSSPMYGSAEEVLGRLLPRLPLGLWRRRLFSATKVWTLGQGAGAGQMARSLRRWGLERFDLMQVHNLLDWESHLPTLRLMKSDGAIRYLGLTTSHGRRHDTLQTLLRREPLDFVQLTYSIAHREAEARLLELARDRGVAVIVNRPFDGGALFDRVRGRPLPGFAAEIGCTSWAAFFLKFIVSHPAVTCAIPATRRVEHMRENMEANRGPLPEAAMRRRMAQHFDAL